jgi:hypothetical protein
MRQILRPSLMAVLFGAACSDAAIVSVAGADPIIEGTVVLHNERNALSALVRLRTQRADSVAVRYRVLGAGDAADSMTAMVRATLGWTRIPVLGLRAAQHYELRVIAFGNGTSVVGEPIAFVTNPLPADIPAYTAAGNSASPGYVAIAAGKYGLVLDNSGRVVWYHHFENGPWLNFMAANGRYVARNVTTDPNDVESWVELDVLGNVTRQLGCDLGLQPRFHDLLIEPDGAYWILCDESRTMNLIEFGGVAEARVTGTAVQHIGAAGELLFHWTPFDHLHITDVDSVTRSGFTVNWTHGNSLDLDADGNLLVSFRNLHEITSIDTRTGAVRWRLGGLRNQFTLSNESRLFAGQHSVRACASGEIVLLDNIGDPLESRAERWAVDPALMTARVASSYGSVPRVRTTIGGSVQALSSTRTLVSFGTEGRVEEYDGDGNVRWRIEGSPGYVFRAQRFPSLYRPGIGAR